ncbi:hypothetical protein [Streptomyces sp. SP17BM10]|uniref:hypothetical protein n=1 Tax=Streptomyces sp. SP17BM10 TaxID=3002530 RepID=UPI003FCE588E
MAMFVHLTSTGDAPRISRAGIRADSRGQGGARGVYCFPVLRRRGPVDCVAHLATHPVGQYPSRTSNVPSLQ